MEKDCFNCKHYNKLRYMRRGCFVDSEFSFCSKTCRIKKELALCADFQPAGKRYPAAECVAELADNIKAAVGRLNNMMNNLFVDARPDDLLRKKKSFEELLAEHEDRAGDNSAYPESKSNSGLGELESSSGGDPAELEDITEDNSAYLDSKSDSRSSELESSSGGNPAELEGRAGDNSAYPESKSNSRLGELENSSGDDPSEHEDRAGDNSAYLGGKGDKSDADD